MQLWVDATPIALIAPNLDGLHPTMARVSKGKHRLGYSVVGAPAPEKQVDAKVVSNHRHIYNPGAWGCYWRHVVLYSDNSLLGTNKQDEHHDRAPVSHDGPISIQEFYDLPDIDYWFTNPPVKEQFAKASQGFWRTALLRNAGCTDLGKRGCPLVVRMGLVSCQTTARSNAEVEHCVSLAEVACETASSTP